MRSSSMVASVLVVMASGAAAQLVWEQRFPRVRPPARAPWSIAYDAARARTVVFGGWTPMGALNDTWEWDGDQWLERLPAHSPMTLGEQRFTHDATRHNTVLLKGGVVGTETWLWDGTDWREVRTVHRPRGAGEALACDPLRGRVVYYGGVASQQYADLDETWEWDGSDWTQRFPAHNPGVRARHVLFYDSVRQRIVLHGGNDQPFHLFNDTWEWDGSDWTQRVTANAPPPRFSASAAFDSRRGRAVLFGGGGYEAMDDTWEYDGTTWTRVFTPTWPGVRAYQGMAYDAARGRIVMFGGNVGPTDDTWEIYGGTPASYRLFGRGCAGTSGTPFLDAEGRAPYLGEPFTLFVGNLPPEHSALLWLGVSNTRIASIPLPLDLSPIGMTGCTLLVSLDTYDAMLNWNGSCSCTLPIPADRALLGARFFNQALTFDRFANPLGVILSNGGEGVIGAR